MSVVTHKELPADVKFVSSMKGNADGEPVAKTRKEVGFEPKSFLLSPRTFWAPDCIRKPPHPGLRTRKKRKIKKNAVQEHSGKYNVVSSLVNAPLGSKFGQLVGVDGEEAKKGIRRLFISHTRRPVPASIVTLPKLLKVVSVHVYGTQMITLLNSGAIPKVINASVATKLSLSPKPTSTRLRLPMGKATCLGSIK